MLGLGQGGGTNPNLVPHEEALQSVRDAVMGAWAVPAAGGEAPKIVAISGPTVAGAEQIVADVTGGRDAVRVSESASAWAAVRPWLDRDFGLPLDLAVTVDAGTGSTACGWNREGERITVGGWGWLLGDEGSGFWIGLRALQAAIHGVDGRGPATCLPVAICDALGLRSLHGAVPLVYQTAYGRSRVAHLAPVVARAAQDGDRVAAAILAEAGRGLAAMVTTIIRRLDIADETFAVVPFGSVFKAGDVILSPFLADIAAVAPRARAVFPRYESVIGTLISAMAQGGQDTAAIWPRIEAEASGLPRVLVKA